MTWHMAVSDDQCTLLIGDEMGHRVIPPGMRLEVSRMMRSGVSFSEIGRRAGLHWGTVADWARAEGFAGVRGRNGGATLARRPAELESTMKPSGPGRRLGIEERSLIQWWVSQGWTNSQIAEELGCARTTIMRELRRNRDADGLYLAPAAHRQAVARRKRPREGRLNSCAELRREVVACLDDRFSPQQIAAHLRREFPDRQEMHVSHETIYQALYVQGRGCLREELAREKALRTGRASRIPRSRLPKSMGKSWVQGANISTRPPEVEDRAVPGHWEGDLVLGAKNQSAIITLVERSSRFTLLRRLPDRHDTESVMPLLIDMISTLPIELRKTLTWDQGSEMSSHAALTLATEMRVYFCDPHSPWQRGSNENTNGLVRDFFPKGIDFRAVSDAEIDEAQALLNKRPRMTLGWQTPTEVLAQAIAVVH